MEADTPTLSRELTRKEGTYSDEKECPRKRERCLQRLHMQEARPEELKGDQDWWKTECRMSEEDRNLREGVLGGEVRAASRTMS